MEPIAHKFLPHWWRHKTEATHEQAWRDPAGSRRLRTPDFMTIGAWRWYGCQPYAPAAFTPKEIFLILMAVRGWVDPRKDCQWRIPMIPSGNESATFRNVARCLNQLRHRVAPTMVEGSWNARHNIIQLQTELFWFNYRVLCHLILSSKNLKRE